MGDKPAVTSEQMELARLRTEVSRLKVEREVLGVSVSGYFTWRRSDSSRPGTAGHYIDEALLAQGPAG